MPIQDPNFWKDAAMWLWGLLALPIAYVWKRSVGAVSKTDLREHLDEDRRVHAEFRDTMRALFQNAESDRKALHDAVTDLRKEMHGIHVDLIEKISGR